jgi:hypothetical protein
MDAEVAGILIGDTKGTKNSKQAASNFPVTLSSRVK